jgi:glycosyltransferase involved in cell wall biosynthesis
VVAGFICQDRTPDELIIADDGSGRDTAQVIKNFSSVSTFPVLHIWHEHKGFKAAKIRNKAIKQSSGDYIILLDGDCIVNRHFVSDHLSLAEKGYFIQGKRVLVKKSVFKDFSQVHANSTLTLIKMSLTNKISNVHHLIRLPFNFSFKNKKLKGIKSCNMSFFRSDILAVNAFNEDFVGWGNEDSELACRFLMYGLKKKINPFMAICFHLWHTQNKVVSDVNKQLLAKAINSKEYFCKNGLFKKN